MLNVTANVNDVDLFINELEYLINGKAILQKPKIQDPHCFLKIVDELIHLTATIHLKIEKLKELKKLYPIIESNNCLNLQNIPISLKIIKDNLNLGLKNGNGLFLIVNDLTNDKIQYLKDLLALFTVDIRKNNYFYKIPHHFINFNLKVFDDSIKINATIKLEFFQRMSISPITSVALFSKLNKIMLYNIKNAEKFKSGNSPVASVTSFYALITENTNKFYNDKNHPKLLVDGINKELMPYQAISVNWMLKNEGMKLNINSNGSVLSVDKIKIDSDIQENQIYDELEMRIPGWNKIIFNETKDSSIINDSIWWNCLNGGIITTSFIKNNLNDKEIFLLPKKSFGFLCEEMGLGKTLEITTLIKLNSAPLSFNKNKKIWLDNYERLVTECKTTLVICPESICNQWKDEIELSSSLSVMIYPGINNLEFNNGSLNPNKVAINLSNHDIVITSYNVLAKELDRAEFNIIKRPKRKAAGDYERHDYSSPLMLLQFFRLVLDEAQLASISLTKVSKFATIIPRFHTWAVSGTIIRKNLDDLHALCKSHHLYPLNKMNLKQWKEIPRFLFDRIFMDRSIRHTKLMVGDQVILPKQNRIMLRSPFTAIENDNYLNMYNNFLQQVGLNEMGDPTIEGFDLDKSKEGMRKWVSRLRKACCHARLVNQQKKYSFLNGKNSKGKGKGKGKINDLDLGGLDDVLDGLTKDLNDEIFTHYCAYLRNFITYGRVLEFLRLPSESSKVFLDLINEINSQIELSMSKLIEIENEFKDNSPKLIELNKEISNQKLIVQNLYSDANKFENLMDLNDNNQLQIQLIQMENKKSQLQLQTKRQHQLQEERNDLLKSKANYNSKKINISKIITSLKEYLHSSYFMLASAYFQHYRPMYPIPDTFPELNVMMANLDNNEILSDKVIEAVESGKLNANDDSNGEPIDPEKLSTEERKYWELENKYYDLADQLLNEILDEPIKKTELAIKDMQKCFDTVDQYVPIDIEHLMKKMKFINSNELEMINEERDIAIPMAVEEEDEEEKEKENSQSDLKNEPKEENGKITKFESTQFNDTNFTIKEEKSMVYGVVQEINPDLVYSLKKPVASFEGNLVIDRILSTIEDLQIQGKVIDIWLTKLFHLQCIPVSKKAADDPTGAEYENQLDNQAESQAYIDQITFILDDREKALTAVEDRIRFDTNDSEEEEDDDDDDIGANIFNKISSAEDAPYISKADLKRRKIPEKNNLATSKIGKSAKFKELSKLRESLIPQGAIVSKFSFKTCMLDLLRCKESLNSDELSWDAFQLTNKHLENINKLMKKELMDQIKLLTTIRTKFLSLLNGTFNSKIAYFRSLQSRSDSLVNYSPEPIDETPKLSAEKELIKYRLKMNNEMTKVNATKSRLNYLKSLNSDDNDETNNQCAICRYTILIGVLTPCGHKYCRECLFEWMKNKKMCPLCKKSLKEEELYQFSHSKSSLKGDVFDEKATKEINIKGNDQKIEHEALERLKNRRMFEKDLEVVYSSMPPSQLREIFSIKLIKSFGTKVDMIIRQIKYLKSKDNNVQILVFTQWNTFLSILAAAFDQEGIIFKSWESGRGRGRGRGKDKRGRTKLSKDIEDFKSNTDITCFLLNTVNQAAGLTFTNASHVFLCEPMVNLSFELQAVSRIHRIGQKKSTTVWNFVIEGTIEESISYLSTKKRLMAAESRQSKDEIKIDEDALDAKEMMKVDGTNHNDGEIINDDDLWAAFFATKDAKVTNSVFG
ncbi:E3 ubiquitin-protein ligase [Martiniozyma asiatica (nom. inval.)]|nr:E3 ubiquitin-protein ligase [Martiniozyma asiatica]